MTKRGSSQKTTPKPVCPLRQSEQLFDGLGFEDDFNDFVGAPVEVDSDRGIGERHVSKPRGALYRALASVEDFDLEGAIFAGQQDDAFEQLDDDADPDLPTRAEIEESSKQIFGSRLGVPAAKESRTKSPSPRSAFAHLHSPLSGDPLVFDSPSSSFAGESDDDDDDFELEAFDLSRVLGALQGMKDEIAGMSDQDARRKAAARVALGLVYGLQRENQRDEHEGRG